MSRHNVPTGSNRNFWTSELERFKNNASIKQNMFHTCLKWSLWQALQKARSSLEFPANPVSNWSGCVPTLYIFALNYTAKNEAHCYCFVSIVAYENSADSQSQQKPFEELVDAATWYDHGDNLQKLHYHPFFPMVIHFINVHPKYCTNAENTLW